MALTVIRTGESPSAAIEVSAANVAFPAPPTMVVHGVILGDSEPGLAMRLGAAEPCAPMRVAVPSGSPRLKSYSSYHPFAGVRPPIYARVRISRG